MNIKNSSIAPSDADLDRIADAFKAEADADKLMPDGGMERLTAFDYFKRGWVIGTAAQAAPEAPTGDDIRGPLTDAQRQECRYLYNNLKHLESAGYHTADDVIRKAAVYGYMNGRHDFASHVAAPEAPAAPSANNEERITLSLDKCIAQFRMYASFHPNKDAAHQLNFCADFLRDFCAAETVPQAAPEAPASEQQAAPADAYCIALHSDGTTTDLTHLMASSAATTASASGWKCPTCRGAGHLVMVRGKFEATCPDCNGTGRAPAPQAAAEIPAHPGIKTWQDRFVQFGGPSKEKAMEEEIADWRATWSKIGKEGS